MKIAIVGATGLVGQVILQVLTERRFPVFELIPAASPRSAGKKVQFKGEDHTVVTVEEALAKRPNIAIFSAGSGASKGWAKAFAQKGCWVIDNSSAWRMELDIPLIVPEVNASILGKNDKVIANPNCSTIQMVAALAPLHQVYGCKRIVVSTYQAVTGSGKIGVDQLNAEREGKKVKDPAYPHTIDLNCLPHGGDFLDNGYTTEEMKLVHETRKILGKEDIQVSATVVRVPVFGGHSESVNVSFEKDFDLDHVRATLKKTEGITLLDDPSKNKYPMPIDAEGKDDVFVGRLRRDLDEPNCLNMWIVSDNLRKGAATNAVQIAEYVLHHVMD